MELAAIAAAVSGMLIAGAVVVVALAATFRRHTDTRRDAYRVLQLLLRRRHKR